MERSELPEAFAFMSHLDRRRRRRRFRHRTAPREVLCARGPRRCCRATDNWNEPDHFPHPKLMAVVIARSLWVRLPPRRGQNKRPCWIGTPRWAARFISQVGARLANSDLRLYRAGRETICSSPASIKPGGPPAEVLSRRSAPRSAAADKTPPGGLRPDIAGQQSARLRRPNKCTPVTPGQMKPGSGRDARLIMRPRN